MEIEDQDGAKMELSYGRNEIKAVFGRGNGFSSDDRTVSRRHLAFEFSHGAKEAGPRVSFEVMGKNPVWVRRNGEEGIRVFRSSENGELSEGDWFCLSGNEPAWFNVSKIGTGDWETRVLDEEDESDLGSSAVIDLDFNVSDIDPVKEFGFVVMGHEFDIYPRHMIRDVKKWDWFLEEDRKENCDDSEEEESGKRKQKGLRKKRKKGQEIEDEDWAGESEDDEQVVGTLRKDIRPNKKYTTRSKDRGKKPQKYSQGSRSSSPNKIYSSNENEYDDDDDEDETLGGFIVGDNDMDTQEEEINEDDEGDEVEEEEILEDDDDEEDE